MFSFRQGVAPLHPALVMSPFCHVCTGTCYDTQVCWLGTGGGGGGCYATWGTCDVITDRTVMFMQAMQPPGDPVEQLGELRKRLEAALASIDAQERVLRERKQGEKGQRG
jgi:hypothetical protein